MAAHQAPPSLGFSRQEHWSGLPFPSPMHEREKGQWSHSVVPNSLRSQGLQPTRLLHPWDSPGKSTGVGCHCLLCIWNSIKKYRVCKEAGNYKHNEKVKQSKIKVKQSDPGQIQMLEWTDRVAVTVIITGFHVFRKVSREKEDIKKETGLSSRDENYNVWKEKHTGWDQQQIRECERKD